MHTTNFPAISRNPLARAFAARLVCEWADLPPAERELARPDLVMALEMRETREMGWQRDAAALDEQETENVRQ